MEDNNDLKENEEVKTENNLETETTNEVVQENVVKEEKSEKKNSIAIISIIAFLLIVVGMYFVLSKELIQKNNNNTPEEKETEKNDETKDETKEEIETLNYTLNVYKQNDLYCLEKNAYCNVVGLTIKTKNENSKVLGLDNEYSPNYILYKDGEELKNYNVNTKKSEIINFESNHKEYVLYPNEDNNKIIGIIYKTNDNKVGYYNVNTKQKLYEGKYNIEYLYQLKQINDNYLSVSMDNEAHLLSTRTEEEKLSYKGQDGPTLIFQSYGKNNQYIFALNSCAGDCITEKIYSNNLKEIYSKTINENNLGFNNNNLYFVEDNQVKKIDMNGKITNLKAYPDVKGIINDNVVYVEDSKLKYENISNNKITEVCDWKSKYFYDTYASRYYSKIDLDRMGETDKQEGLYIVVDYSGKDSNGNYGMEYCYKANGEVVKYPITQEIGGRAKPVLYLYPTKTTNVKVEFEHPEYLTTTYPKYNKSWEVKAYPNGDLYDKDNKYYYGLYWDETRYNEVDFKEGFYVTKENAIGFLEEKLTIIGLNPRERNEFIMYWLPILENNEKSLVYFELTKEREMGNKLIITPKPDSMLRVSIHIKKVNDKVNIKEQKLEKFTRKGFTAIEWGGMTY